MVPEELAVAQTSLRRLVRGRAPRLYAGLGRLRRSLRLDDSLAAGPDPSPPVAPGHVGRSDRDLLEEIRPAVERAERPNVAVLTGGAPSVVARLVNAEHLGTRVREYDVRVGEGALHTQLAAHGPFHVIVDDTGQSADRVALLRSTFFHSRRGGVYVVRHHRQRGPGQGQRMTDFVARLIQTKGRPGQKPTTRAAQDRTVLADTVESMVVRPRHVFLTSTRTAKAKLSDVQVDEVLRLNSRRGHVVSTRPGLHFDSLAQVSSSRPEGYDRIPVGFDVPSVSLREYVDVVCRPGQVVTQRNVLLPDSYRHNQRHRLLNSYVEDVAPRFGTPRESGRPEHLEGSYFYLDSEFRGHFGHAMTEQLSRLWAWSEAKQREPGLKALVTDNNKFRHVAQFEKDLYEAGGIDPDDLVLASGAVRVDRLFAATPMFSNPAYVHPEIVQTWQQVGDRLAAAAPEGRYPERIFCARTKPKRPCRNAAEVERFFEERGFQVVHTERYPLAEQARLFRDAKVVAGYAGSAMLNLLFSGEPKPVVLVASEAYHARNEYLVAAALGHRLYVAWCDAGAVPGPLSSSLQHAEFSFDVDREGAWVEQVLRDL